MEIIYITTVNKNLVKRNLTYFQRKLILDWIQELTVLAGVLLLINYSV